LAARILIADDNVLVRRALRRVLEETGGWQVYEAGNGREAVEKAQELSPDLIILDLAMPEMDGLASTREISKRLPHVPILLHTLYWSPRIVIEALKAGARKAILKSQSNAVIAAVTELLSPPAPRLLAILQKAPGMDVAETIPLVAEIPPPASAAKADEVIPFEKVESRAPSEDRVGEPRTASDDADGKRRKIS
jgi:CheY-like chemotaxis protein